MASIYAVYLVFTCSALIAGLPGGGLLLQVCGKIDRDAVMPISMGVYENFSFVRGGQWSSGVVLGGKLKVIFRHYVIY